MVDVLVAEDLHTYYGTSYVLQGVSLQVEIGEMLVIVGRNGVGKTTTMRSIMGLTRPRRGRIVLGGHDVTHVRTEGLAKRGLALVPQGRHIFGSLTVRENLSVGVVGGPGAWSIGDVEELFPALKDIEKRRGSALSGGEQSMLAIGRALRAGPRCLLLDEPTEGLAPVIVDSVVDALRNLRQSGRMGIIAVLPEVALATSLGDRVEVMERGRIVYSGTSAEFSLRRDIHDRYLGLGSMTREGSS